MTIFDRIKTLAEKRNKNIKEVALELGFGENLFYKWKKQSPTSDKLQRVADYFDVSTDYLIGHTVSQNDVDKEFVQFFRAETDDLSEEEKAEMVDSVKAFLEVRKAIMLNRKEK